MKVTQAQIEARIQSTEYQLTHDTLTLCFITLDNGFVVTGESRPIDPLNFDALRGQEVARAEAIDKLWPYFGFVAMEQAHMLACVKRQHDEWLAARTQQLRSSPPEQPVEATTA